MKLISSPLESRRLRWMFRPVGLLLVGVLFLASITPSWALAQSTEEPWAEPLNLSHSGIATNPGFVIDSEGVGHVIWQEVWQEELGSYIYTQFDGDEWSAPETTELDRLFRLSNAREARGRSQLAIYSGPNPLFIAGPGKHIFAFWIPADGRLYTSRVENADFKNVARWSSRRPVTPQAAAFAVAVDASGELHLAYLRTVDDPVDPAGIYYTRTKNGGSTWSVPVLLQQSPYLRRLAEGEANLSVATTGTEDALRVYVGWDNRPRKQVFLAQSADAGETWEQPVLVAGPAPDSGLGSFNIHVGASQNNVVLVWQSGVPGGACSQIYQFSTDAGTTWSHSQPMIEDLLGCAPSNGFVPGLANSPDSPLQFLTETKSQVFLSAWNGTEWSQAQEQTILSGFEEPEIFTEVIFGCHRASLSAEQLYIVGCDQGGGGDVWVTSRDLGSKTSLSSLSVWSQPSHVTEDKFEIEAVELVSTDDGLVHAFFSEHQDPAIYYTYWDGELWSNVGPVLELPDGEAGWPAIAAGPGDELFLIAPNNKGALYFSRATSGNASRESRWSPPTRLGIGHDGEIGSVDVAWDAAGTVYVAYSVPVNEKRGIYLILSKDGGTTWSEPLQVFNGAAAGFDLVGAPSLLTSADGFLHIIWKEQAVQGDGAPQPLSLYYTRSEDAGESFKDAELVVEESVAWREIVTDGKNNLHLLWQGEDTLTTVWDQVSLAGEHTWQHPQGLPNEGRTAAVMVDPDGRLHLVNADPASLGYWLWDGSRWQSEEPFRWTLTSQQEVPVDLLAAAVNKQGKMVVVLAIPAEDGDAGEKNLLYSTRTLKLPSRPTAVKEVATQTVISPTLTPATPTPEASLTPAGIVVSEAANAPGQTDGNETSGRISPFIMTLVPVALLLLVVLGMVIRRAARDQER